MPSFTLVEFQSINCIKFQLQNNLQQINELNLSMTMLLSFTLMKLYVQWIDKKEPVKGVDEGGDGDEYSNDKDDPSEEDAGDTVEK